MKKACSVEIKREQDRYVLYKIAINGKEYIIAGVHLQDGIDFSEYAGKNKILYFEKPYRFRAQNSSNRTGYGWTWDWRNGYGDYTEGTYYGETTEYVFAGIYVA